MKPIIVILCAVSLFLLFFMHKQKSFEKAVRAAVERQMEHYPQSTLKDLYKNFFQDKYGPGHLATDTALAGNYLRQELASYTFSAGEISEPLGWQGKFLRVNLSVVKDGTIPYPIFFDAFIRSVNNIETMPLTEWRAEWKRIEAVIASMHLSIPNYEADKIWITKLFKQGSYIGHHSEAYKEAYDPHYRIISRKIYEKEFRPILIKAGLIK